MGSEDDRLPSATLVAALVKSLRTHVPDVEVRKRVYADLIEFLEREGTYTHRRLMPDPAYNEVLLVWHPWVEMEEG